MESPLRISVIAVLSGWDWISAASLMLPAAKWLDHIVQGSLLNDVNLLAKLKGIDERFLKDELHRRKHPVP
ncbi:hypothetical protein LOK49_LG15G02651 [Camellia lanceoleosa]|uniref:Uncharacterized protein n=1 Tax=Camellia lanceoleosa TaxID=1840588 RepID=A0ACC0F6I8_9ERIC|nr:hypothetical protein LOK49_LG15G02651 [Camellia lanceoleosa]